MKFLTRMMIWLSVLTTMFSCRTLDIEIKKSKNLRKNSKLKNRLVTISSGRIGCAPEKIAIAEYYEFNTFHENWEAHCLMKVFYCSANHTDFSCVPEMASHRPNPRPVSPLQPAGDKVSPQQQRAIQPQQSQQSQQSPRPAPAPVEAN